MVDTVTEEACIESKRFFLRLYIFLQRSNILALVLFKNDEEVMKWFIMAYCCYSSSLKVILGWIKETVLKHSS